MHEPTKANPETECTCIRYHLRDDGFFEAEVDGTAPDGLRFVGVSRSETQAIGFALACYAQDMISKNPPTAEDYARANK